MKRQTFLATLFFGLLPLSARAQSIEELTQRMRARVGQIDALKRAGLVGEDNRGFLSPRGSLNGGQRALVDAENGDRRSVYAQLAQRNGVSAAQVGSQRAADSRRRAAAGVWIQEANGEWRRK